MYRSHQPTNSEKLRGIEKKIDERSNDEENIIMRVEKYLCYS
jgi:hypothetical protein